jgi:glycosyltransferase involved in cell wall biosynthesis
VYAGEAYLEGLVAKLNVLREEWEKAAAPVRLAEAIFVIDSAIDSSEAVLRQLESKFKWVRVLTLARNFGQHPATMAGISYSSGEWVVTLDEDLQHDPAYIPQMLQHAAANALDVVYAKPTHSVHKGFWRDFSSRRYKQLMSRLTNNPYITHFNSFRLMRGVVARAAASVSSHETYFDVALVWYTNRIDSISFRLTDIRHAESGKSSYNFRNLVSHGRRMLVTSSSKHLRVGALLGVFAIVACLALASRALLQKVMNPESVQVPGWTSLFIGLLLLGGLTLLLLSIIIEYLTIVLLHSQGKPTFFVIDRSFDKEMVAYFSSLGALRVGS